MNMQSIYGVNSDDVVRALYRQYLEHADEIPLSPFLYGAMVVMSEVFPDPMDPTKMSPAVPSKLWLFGTKGEIVRQMRKAVEV
jgi:hypothetical protein